MVQNSKGTKRYRVKSLFSLIYPLVTPFPSLETTNIIGYLCILPELFMSV